MTITDRSDRASASSDGSRMVVDLTERHPTPDERAAVAAILRQTADAIEQMDLETLAVEATRDIRPMFNPTTGIVELAGNHGEALTVRYTHAPVFIGEQKRQ